MIEDGIMMSTIKTLYPGPQRSRKGTLSCKYSSPFSKSGINVDIHHSATNDM